MGQSVTRLPDLPGPEVERHRRNNPRRRHSKRYSYSKTEGDEFKAPLRSQRHTPDHKDSKRNRANRRSVLTETDGNKHRSEQPLLSKEKIQRHRSSRIREDRGETWEEKGSRLRRTRQAEHSHSNRAPRSRAPRSAKRGERPRNRDLEKRKVNVEVVELEDLTPKKDCIVCTEKRSLRHFPIRLPTTQCEHEISTCKRCLRNWIKMQFETKVWDQIGCPECRVRMQYEDMREFAPADVFRRYDTLSTKATLEAIPGFRWCTAKGCKSGQVHEGHLTPRFRCISCKASHCILHQVRWHKGETCAEYDYRTDGKLKKAENDASKKLIKDTAKRCPGCKWNIEKNYGCDHMTCSKCRQEFCWVCLAPYGPIRNQGNHMHRPGCEHRA